MDGVLVIDKPVGPTSHDVVARVRRALDEKRVGHTGTLDPAASGVLPLVLGRATRLARFLTASDKTYDALVRLGWSTDTGDAEGAPSSPIHEGILPGRESIDAALDASRGTFLQQPPAYSAKKLDGRRGYALARANQDPRFQPVSVTAHAIELVGVAGDLVTLRVTCSAGFYVRSLAGDLGTRLGTGAHLASLRRIESGGYAAAAAMRLETVERDPAAARGALVPLAQLLPELPAVVLTTDGATRAAHGRELGPGDVHTRQSSTGVSGSWIRLLDSTGRLLGLAQVIGGTGLLHPSVVLM